MSDSSSGGRSKQAMAAESPSEGRGEEVEEVISDLISLLPDAILITILSLVPFVDAIRTSALSKRWRYLWTSIPCLDLFDLLELNSRWDDPERLEQKYISIFNHIFGSRRAPLQVCELPIFPNWPVNSYSFFAILDQLRIQKLRVYNMPIDLKPYVSSNLFLCQSLRELRLMELNVVLPTQFRELPNLRVLRLERVKITGRPIDDLVSGCPNLEEMLLLRCKYLRDPQITAPNLLSMEIGINVDERSSFSLTRAPRLKRVVLSYSSPSIISYSSGEEVEKENDEHNKVDEARNLVKLLMNSGHLERLCIICWVNIFEYTSIMRLPDSLPTGHQLIHLKELSMNLNLDDFTMVSPMLFLLTSCPNLQRLGLHDASFKTRYPIKTDYWDKRTPPNCLVNQLMTVRMRNVRLESKNVIEFVKFILINARVLVRMKLHCRKSFRDQSEENIVGNEVLLFKRASPQALVEVSEMKFPRDFHCHDF